MRTVIVVAALLFSGCANKLKHHVGDIDSISVHAREGDVNPSVDLGDLPAPDDSEDTEGVRVNRTVGHVAIEVFETSFAIRLLQLVDNRQMARRVAEGFRESFPQGRPLPVRPGSDWDMEVRVVNWGVGADFNNVAEAELQLDVSLFSPEGERVWRRQISCGHDLAPDLYWDVRQIAANLGVISSMTDRQIQQVYRSLTVACAENLEERWRVDVRRAREKARKMQD